jgi:circadian clock protein KaiC
MGSHLSQHNPPIGIEKTPTGIEGFDEVIGGGLPRNRTTLVVGSAGTGKTVFALQFLVNGARKWGSPGIFVAFEENSHQLIANAASFGWDLQALEDEKLFFLDARMSADIAKSGNFDLAGLLASLRAKADEMGARRIVFDSIGVLLTLMNDPVAEREELYRVHDWLSSSGLTGIITARLEGDDLSSLQRYDFLQFMSDCIVVLHHRVANRISVRELRVIKYRGSAFAENEFPLTIGSDGIEVATFGYANPQYPAFTERVSTGIARLDDMLEGGYFRGSSTLISGAPGTAKSTLAAAFIDSGCWRGEPALYVSFDETAEEIVRNLASVNIHLQPHLDAGQLHMYSIRSDSRSAEEHLLQLKKYMDGERISCLVVDPISAMLKAGGFGSALNVAQRLLHLAKSRGITTLLTSLLEGNDAEVEATQLQISTVADTWIHLSYVIHGGERNRALTIIKSRGTAHSNQVRELRLSSKGLTLEDVYTAGGAVLMGAQRWEKEIAVAAERARSRAELELKRREFEAAETEILARIEALQRELESRRQEFSILNVEQNALELGWQDGEQALRERRGEKGDHDGLGSAGSEPVEPETGHDRSREG